MKLTHCETLQNLSYENPKVWNIFPGHFIKHNASRVTLPIFFLNLCPKKYHTFYIFLHRAHNRNLLEAEIKCFKSPNLTPSPLKNLTSPAKKYQHQEYYLRKKITTNYHFKIITTSQITCFFPINHSK